MMTKIKFNKDTDYEVGVDEEDPGKMGEFAKDWMSWMRQVDEYN